MQVIETFKKLSAIPRCSHHADAMKTYLLKQGEAYGYRVHTDAAGNVLCTRPDARITLQAHYDMVCIGNTASLEIRERSGWLEAEGSTLGADNGIGMAMMLTLMAEGAPVDALFTADEEVGLLGARALELPLQPLPMLNLDSEAEGEVTIGCAGGVDVTATKTLSRQMRQAHCYRIEVSGLPGGHSGVDIDKGIPNAIKELSARLDAGAKLVEIAGGERRNAIPRQAYAVIASEHELEGLESLGYREVSVIEQSPEIVAMLQRFEHGVRRYDDVLDIVHSSINLAQVSTEDAHLRIQLSARAMETQALRDLEAETVAFFEAAGCLVKMEGFYPPWAPERNAFAQRVLDAHRDAFPEASFAAIHAGLECGVIKERYPAVEMASIGPNIEAPHSTAERVEIASVARVFEVVRRIVDGSC
jgi:dipeptidase D